MSPRKYLQLVLMNATISGHRCTKYFCVKQTGAIIQKKTFHQLCKKMNHKIKLQSPSPARSVHVDKAVAFVRRGAARETGSGKLQLHGNMKTTPSWQGIHLRGKRLLGGRSGWVSGGVSSEIKKIIFCYTGLKSRNILEDVGRRRRDTSHFTGGQS